MITKEWVICNGEGHWNVFVDGSFYASCDNNELYDVLDELSSPMAA